MTLVCPWRGEHDDWRAPIFHFRGPPGYTKALVRGREKDRTKTREDREIRLCGRALEVLRRQLALREQLACAGKRAHDYLFCTGDGAPVLNLSYPYDRWRYVLEKTRIPYREPYYARHSFVSWRLMVGHNVLLVAKEDGHSPYTMLTTYAAWTEGATETDVDAIRRAMERSPERACTVSIAAPDRPLQSPRFATGLPLEPDGKRYPGNGVA